MGLARRIMQVLVAAGLLLRAGPLAAMATPIPQVDSEITASVPDGGYTLVLLGCALVGLGLLHRKLRR
jgi:hypothetical protein